MAESAKRGERVIRGFPAPPPEAGPHRALRPNHGHPPLGGWHDDAPEAVPMQLAEAAHCLARAIVRFTWKALMAGQGKPAFAARHRCQPHAGQGGSTALGGRGLGVVENSRRTRRRGAVRGEPRQPIAAPSHRLQTPSATPMAPATCRRAWAAQRVNFAQRLRLVRGGRSFEGDWMTPHGGNSDVSSKPPENRCILCPRPLSIIWRAIESGVET